MPPMRVSYLHAELFDKIEKLMAEQNVSQRDLAARIGVSQSTLIGMLNDSADAKLSTVERLFAALGRKITFTIDEA